MLTLPSRLSPLFSAARLLALLAVSVSCLIGCDSKTPRSANAGEDPQGVTEPGPADGETESGEGERTLVLYSSADAEVIKPLVALFEREAHVKVKWVGDTEQTKTTGLVQRLIDEQDAPKADLWWSSEPFGTIRLARAGLLDAYTSKKAEESMSGGWPPHLRAVDGTWYGFAPRARVIVYNFDKVKKNDIPRNISSLIDPKFKGRVGMARPQFGTTGGHMAALALVYGDAALRDWLRSMVSNNIKLYDGNMAVVRAVSTGEILVGLTDTDDVWGGKRNRWPVDMVYEPNDLASSPLASFKGWGKVESLALGAGPLVLPNTVAIVKGSRNARDAQKFIDFILSEKVERLLVESESHNIPIRPKVLGEQRYAKYAIPMTTMQPMTLDLEKAADMMDSAMKACDEELKGR